MGEVYPGCIYYLPTMVYPTTPWYIPTYTTLGIPYSPIPARQRVYIPVLRQAVRNEALGSNP